MNGTFVSEEIGIVSDETISDLVLSLQCIGDGSCRIVYDLGDCVLKLNRDAAYRLHGSCETESAHWEAFQGTESEDLFAPVYASGDGWLVMAKADRVGQYRDESDFYSLIHKANRLGITDLFYANVGLFGNVWKVIDYATGSLGQDCSSERCECGDHDCEACYPEGCDCCCDRHDYDGCGQLSGCNETECEWCYEKATVAFSTLFGFVATTHYGCEDCARENGLQLPIVATEIRGQGRFVQGLGNVLVLDAVTQTKIAHRYGTEERCLCGCTLQYG